MAKKLRENITSDYMEAANRLNSKKTKRRIVAYVESYDDVFFWRTVFSQFENDQRYFEVSYLHATVWNAVRNRC